MTSPQKPNGDRIDSENESDEPNEVEVHREDAEQNTQRPPGDWQSPVEDPTADPSSAEDESQRSEQTSADFSAELPQLL